MFGWGTLAAVKMAVRGGFSCCCALSFGTYPLSARALAGGGSRGIHAARPTPRHLHSACTQVAIGVVWEIARLEARSTANTAVRPDAIPVGDAGGHDGSDCGASFSR
jgi:hypothetical protein